MNKKGELGRRHDMTKKFKKKIKKLIFFGFSLYEFSINRGGGVG